MAESGLTRPLSGWQRAHVLAAAQYLRAIVIREAGDVSARAAYEGLLEVLDPERRAARQRREMSQTGRGEQRSGRDRRQADRRQVALGPPAGRERRKRQRRSSRDRRS
jgi:hypothetical protein